jgi:glycosyltransferase involved in cell wall biosynthesis
MITLSIVIPAFDEEQKIGPDVRAAAAFLASGGIRGEVIVADDGSSDRTAERAEALAHGLAVPLSVIRCGDHRGKGAAVRSGILSSAGEFVLFADSGVTVPFDSALSGLQLLREGHAEIANGSRELPGSVIRRERDWDRRLISRLFRTLVLRWMHIPRALTDTQCGFKLYRGDVARTLYAECTTEGFMFDIEIILRAMAHGWRIVEFPVEWTCDRDSRLGIRRSARPVIRDLLRIRRTLVTRPPSGRT